MDIQSTTDSGGGYNVGWIANGSVGGKSIIVKIDNETLGTVSFNGTGGWQNWTAKDWSGGDYNHANAGNQMVYQNTLYQANWYTNS